MATEIRGLDEQANYKVSQSVSKSLTTKAYMQCKKSLFIEKWKESLAIQNISPGNATPLLGYLANLVPVHGHHLQDSKQWSNRQKVDYLSKKFKKYPSELLDTNEMILERRICKTKLFYDDIWVDHTDILTLKSTSPQQLQGQRGPSIFRISVPASSLITNLVEDGDDDDSDDEGDDDLGMKSHR